MNGHPSKKQPFEPGSSVLAEYPARRIVNPLFGLLYHGEPLVRWRAVSAMGAVVARLAREDIESARVVMRRLMWNLNDESGGIGWGSPEAMGDIMARHHRLADEYSAILVSYLNPDGNVLEHEGLQAGVLWSLGRLGRARPELAAAARSFLPAFLPHANTHLLGLALWCAYPIAGERIQSLARACLNDRTAVTIYSDGQLRPYTVSDLAVAVVGDAFFFLIPTISEIAYCDRFIAEPACPLSPMKEDLGLPLEAGQQSRFQFNCLTHDPDQN